MAEAFEEIRPDEAEEEGVEVIDIRENLVFSTVQGGTNLDFKVGRIPIADGVGYSSIILIAEIDRQLLVGVPRAAWHKKTANRLLPSGALSKPILTSVASCSNEGRDAPSERFVKMWIGLLHVELEETIEFSEEEMTDLSFVGEDDYPAVPFGVALVELASEKFTFLTADSGAGGEGKIEDRLKDLEKNFGKIQESLQALLRQKQKPEGELRARAKPAPAPASRVPKTLKGLDPTVVRSALAAGVPEDHLAEVAGVLGKQPNKMEDLPRGAPKKAGEGGLSESEEEMDDLEEEAEAGGATDGGVAKAIVKLTKVCSVLAAQKSSRAKDPIERILDQPSSSGSLEGFGSGSSRRNAAALQALRKCLTEKPQYIFTTIEDRLQEDFASRPASWRRYCERVARNSEPHTELHWPCAVDLGGGSDMAVPGGWKGSRSSSEVISSGGSCRPGSCRQRQLAPVSSPTLGVPASFWGVSESSATRSPRTPPLQSSGSEVDGITGSPCQRSRQLPRSQEATWERWRWRFIKRDWRGQAGQAHSKGEAKSQSKVETPSSERCGGRSRMNSHSRIGAKMDIRTIFPPDSLHLVGADHSDNDSRGTCPRDRCYPVKLSSGCETLTSEPFGKDLSVPDAAEPRLHASTSGVRDVSTEDATTVKVPGSGAGTYLGRSLCNVTLRYLCSSKSGLGIFARTSVGLATKQSEDPAITESFSKHQPRGFPIPVPYPEVLRTGSKETANAVARKKMVNCIVIVLNYLHLSRPIRCPAHLKAGNKLTASQWETVRRFEDFLDSWIYCESIGPEQMGRTAPKVESIEESILRISSLAAKLRSSGTGDYFKGSDDLSACGRRRDAGRVVGTCKSEGFSTFKTVEPSRLSFIGVPSFDPCPYLDEQSAAVFRAPLQHSRDPETHSSPLPFVRVHCSPDKKLQLFNLLDSSGRLGLHAPENVRPKFASGVFAVVKDSEKDRLILDSRPSNELEIPLTKWIGSLASPESLCRIQLLPSQQLRMSGNDLRDFYYLFQVSEERSRRNILAGPVEPSSVKNLSCYRSEFDTATCLFGSLATMAMGDCQAVTLAQTCHIGLTLQSGVSKPETLMNLKGPLPRGEVMVGVLIDDFVTICKSDVSSSGPSESARLADKMEQKYVEVGLIPHPKKAFRDEGESSFWGADIDGVKGQVRGSLKRAIPLCGALLQVGKLGHVSVELLESLVGSLVSLFLFRRRLLCLLDAVYQTCQGRRGDALVKLSGRGIGEILMCAVLLPLACTNLRAEVSPRITATDASSWWECSVTSQLPPRTAVEMRRHSLRKSVWSRLLAPGRAWLRSQGILDPSLELPEATDEFVMNPLWQVLASGLQYKLLLSRKSPCSRHISIGELRAYLAAEKELGFARPSSRELFGLDSQVVLGLLSKGRSASPSLNWELSKSVPTILGFDLYHELFYFETSMNPSDDPTRGRKIRAPTALLPEWWEEVASGCFSQFDSWLADFELDDHSMSGLPDFSELGFDARSEPTSTAAFVPNSSSDVGTTCFSEETKELSKGEESSAIDSNHRTRSLRSPAAAPLASSPLADEPSGADLEPSQPAPRPADDKRFVGLFGPLNDEDNKFVLDFLSELDPSQIHGSVEWPPTSPGYLDLFSGEKGVVAAWCQASPSWAISFEILDSPGQDLNDDRLRSKLLRCLELGVFMSLGAAPVCSSFSVAITPPVRSRDFPFGKPDVSEKMKVKLEEGNSSAAWVLKIAEVCRRKGIPFWIENPDLSFMFRLPDWVRFVERHRPHVDFWRFDQCRFWRKWRKRTRILTNTCLKGMSLFCRCGGYHIALRGRSKQHRMSWTRVAQAYPRQLCRTLAVALVSPLDRTPKTGGFDGSQFARCCHRRIGEAKNPGPPERRVGDLDAVRLIEARTEKLQSKIWNWFLGWLSEQMSPPAIAASLEQPELLCLLIGSFGRHLYSSGKSQYVYRHLVVFTQKNFVFTRPFMSKCWDLLQKWERIEPTVHRAPIPSSILRAMVVVALNWGWWRFSCCLVTCFYGILRPGEFLKAYRRDLVLPSDLVGESSDTIFLKVSEPKSRFRGRGRVQHASIHDPTAIRFLEAACKFLKPNERLYDISGSSFRRRWNAILDHLNIQTSLKITPGSLRAGGAVFEYRRGTDLMKLLWRMRLKQLSTLESYVQEVAAEVVFSDLSFSSQKKVRLLSEIFEPTLSVWKQL